MKIKIGHLPSNDCVLADPTVSRTHAELDVDPDNRHATLRDLGSLNGTYVNGRKITTDTRISITDTLQFGKEILTLSDILTKIKKKTVIRTKGRRTIGRDCGNDIVMDHDTVSGKHAVIYQEDSGEVIIEDLNSTNGTYVNGKRITQQTLNAGDKVTIAKDYTLYWENIFPPNPKPKLKPEDLKSEEPKLKPEDLKSEDPKPTKKWWRVAAVIAAFFVLCGGGYYLIKNTGDWGKWTKEKTYKEYHSAVCWVFVQYGYQLFVNGEDFTPMFCEYLKIPYKGTIHIAGDEPLPGNTASQGTAFFISKDGKLATNLHITRPWLFSKDKEELEDIANKLVAIIGATLNPMLLRSKVEAKCVIQGIYIIPDGLPICDANAIECEEIKGHDDINKDVAILQTKTRKLPPEVTRIIDINNADLREESLTEGKTIFTIGFPYGVDIALNSNQELKNQVHDGAITQNRGDYEFGHDAETAGGASGSPIFNVHGRLIGVHHAGMTGITGAQGFNSAIKAKYLKELL